MPIALTGATGFLGLRLLRGLLREHPTLIVLARGEPAVTLDRIGRFLEAVGDRGLAAGLPARARVLRADVTLPRCGLSAEAFAGLAGELDALWHSAGDTTLDGDLGALRRVNVEGTRHVLELVAAGRRRPPVYHVSTAFVAGRRRLGTVYDDELGDAHGFETPYERSKYEAEVLVRAWSAEHRRAAVVFRPSVLVTDMAPAPGMPPHPLLFAARALRALWESGGPAPGGRPVVRVAGHPGAHLNVIPVEDAAAVMLELAGRPPAERLDTYHVVHGDELPVATLLRALEEVVPVRFALVPEVADPSPLEARLQLLSSALAYSHHRRRYDDARVRALTTARPARGPIGARYLVAGIRPAAGSAPAP